LSYEKHPREKCVWIAKDTDSRLTVISDTTTPKPPVRWSFTGESRLTCRGHRCLWTSTSCEDVPPAPTGYARPYSAGRQPLCLGVGVPHSLDCAWINGPASPRGRWPINPPSGYGCSRGRAVPGMQVLDPAPQNGGRGWYSVWLSANCTKVR